MLYACVEKQGKYRDGWVERRIAFDTEACHMYCSAKESGHHHMWKHKVKVVRIIAKAIVTKIDYTASNFDPRDLFAFKVEGSYRSLRSGPLPELERAESSHPVLCPRPPEDPEPLHPVEDEGTGGMLAWYFRMSNETDFMTIYTTIRDVLIREGMRPPQFWGLPKMDPRIQVPLAEPPLYLWLTFRAIKQSVMYACVHGHMAVKHDKSSPAGSLKLSKDRVYLVLFDNSVMVFRENGQALTGIPTTAIKTFHYATTDVDESVKYPRNSKCRCFMAFLSTTEAYQDILFVPTLERFADANETNVPAAQVNCVLFALKQMAPLTCLFHQKAGNTDAPPIEIAEASVLTAGQEGDVEKYQNGLVDVYARELVQKQELHLPEEVDASHDKCKSDQIINNLPAPLHLSTLASKLGIKMKKSLTDYPDRYEYFEAEATVADPTCPQKVKNPLLDLFLYSGVS
ncbi:hypothetical protein DQ04_07311000 [Trypanosoma grayi]|uniref:hypothetical protein n=1 Tax=Trypanosoma grayi TaxID=71804 RepID=UPI0004F4352D|nr:hypothetical protein DQ04_07311000 [Trypanosoma grayi]KEG08382.1 hypothetical protein DQ04_07311000 [Trypanosoma grayi]